MDPEVQKEQKAKAHEEIAQQMKDFKAFLRRKIAAKAEIAAKAAGAVQVAPSASVGPGIDNMQTLPMDVNELAAPWRHLLNVACQVKVAERWAALGGTPHEAGFLPRKVVLYVAGSQSRDFSCGACGWRRPSSTG